MKTKIEVDVNIEDVIVTAVEGGSNYWADFFNNDLQVRLDKLVPKDEHHTPFSIRLSNAIKDGHSFPVYDAEEPDELLGHLDKVSLHKAVMLMSENGHMEQLQHIIDEEYDIWDTDILMQYAVLGEITFG